MKGRDCGAPYRSTEKIEVWKLEFGNRSSEIDVSKMFRKRWNPAGVLFPFRISSKISSKIFRTLSVGTSKDLLQRECGRIVARVSCPEAFVPET